MVACRNLAGFCPRRDHPQYPDASASLVAAQWRYALWLPMLLVLVLPALPAVPFGLFAWKSGESLAVAPPPPAISDTMVPGTEKVSETVAGRSNATAVNPFAIAWLIGAGVVVVLGVIGYQRNMRRIVTTALTLDETLLRSIHTAAQEAGLGRMPRVLAIGMTDRRAADSPIPRRSRRKKASIL